VRAFGFHPWALVLPQVIEGIVTVLVLYRAVTRLAGPAAGLIAALVLAVSPATVALDRGNISDSLMILLLVLAADAVSAAIADEDERFGRLGGATGRLVLAGVWVGLAFQAKMIEAWMVLPALGLAYLLTGPGDPPGRPARHRGRGRRARIGVLDDRGVAGPGGGPPVCRRQPRRLDLRAGVQLQRVPPVRRPDPAAVAGRDAETGHRAAHRRDRATRARNRAAHPCNRAAQPRNRAAAHPRDRAGPAAAGDLGRDTG
jgi:hypothetical protein